MKILENIKIIISSIIELVTMVGGGIILLSFLLLLL